ncbi:programmed cell death 6-interacting protein [Phlebotomus argentipes]|uniref:programmed cell death 6-interacting protein n=1 Tax=Phlebotomus argentipes TaxID=94469 RepID=UPI002892A4F4|nr:programmed cell death 6-interacting protein [Phlebotomus argentipes]
MSDLLIVPLKKPSEVDVVKPLKNLIQSSYGSSDKVPNYGEAVNEFSKLRNSAIWKFFEKYESSLDIVYNYYDQLSGLEAKVPVQELQIPFKWKDAFSKGSLFGGRASLTLSSLAYEKVCVLFNIAGLESAVAAAQSLDSDEGLRLATRLFQHSAGIFTHLKAAVPAAIPQEPTPDLYPEVLTILSNLMVAQAQEIFVVKAIRDKMKEQVIAKLCCQCEEFYAECLRGLQKESVKNLWEKEWVTTVAGKQAGFHAMTQLYSSLACRASKKVGEEIARLQHAVELFKAAQSRSGKSTMFQEYADRAQRNLVESKKDNDFIYNEIIPDVKTLEGPGKAQLAKVTALAAPMGQNYKDLFVDLVPVALHQALSACEARKTEMVNAEIQKLREGTQMLNSVLASLNLPAAIENTAGGSGLPPSLQDKAKAVRDNGGISQITGMFKELPEALTRNKEILDECDRLLNDERDSDNALKNQFKERWTRTPSDKLTEVFRTNIAKYRDIINKAVQADGVVRGKFDTHVNGIEILSKSPAELERSVPSSGSAGVSDSPSVQKLRSLMESVETIKAERDAIEAELKSATVNMKEQFLSALAKDGAINEPAMSVSEIGKTLAPLQGQVQESLKRQEGILAEVQSAHTVFTSESGGASNSRDALLIQLAAAYDTFMELQGNLREGTKFYNELTELLVAFQNKISDFCFARKTEKEELMKDLTQQSSRSVAPTPVLPAHHATTPAAPTSAVDGSMPYPTGGMANMPMPYGASPAAPYPTYMAPPMPQSYNPYAPLPYPQTPYYQGFPQGPPPSHYATYPGSLAHQQQQQPGSGYPRQPGW